VPWYNVAPVASEYEAGDVCGPSAAEALGEDRRFSHKLRRSPVWSIEFPERADGQRPPPARKLHTIPWPCEADAKADADAAMPTTTPHPRRTRAESRDEHAALPFTPPIVAPLTAPIHTWFTSPARSHPNAAQAKELPLHLIQLILSYVGALRRLAMSADAARSSTMPPTSRASRARRGCSIT
jgi:hypothetical protein